MNVACSGALLGPVPQEELRNRLMQYIVDGIDAVDLADDESAEEATFSQDMERSWDPAEAGPGY